MCDRATALIPRPPATRGGYANRLTPPFEHVGRTSSCIDTPRRYLRSQLIPNLKHKKRWPSVPISKYVLIFLATLFYLLLTSLYDPPLPRLLPRLYFQVNTVVCLFWIMLKISTWLVVFFVPPKPLLPFVPLFTISLISIKTVYAIYCIYLTATL